jgi:uncharacterized coiled-coil DUF342 family protein
MKLAEMLNERKAVKDEIKKIRQRLELSVKIQEGDREPAEPPEELKQALIQLYEKLEKLISKINRTNVDVLIEGKSLMEMIAERDRDIAVAAALNGLAEDATPRETRFSRSEIRFLPAVNIKELRKEADAYSKKAREIDNKIQGVNWTTEVEFKG